VGWGVKSTHNIVVFVWDTAALASCWWAFGWKAALVLGCTIACVGSRVSRAVYNGGRIP
jgi:hypothetical protein